MILGIRVYIYTVVMLYGLSCNRFDSKVALVCCRQRSRTVCGWGMASPCTDSRRNQTAKLEMNFFKWFKWIFSNFVFQKLRDWVVQHCDQFSNGFLRSTSEMVRNDPALVVCWLGRVSAKVPAIGPDDCAGKQSHLQKLEVKSWKRTKTALFIFNCLDICLFIYEFDVHLFLFKLQVSVQSFHWLESCSSTYFGGLYDPTEFPRGTSVDFVPCTAFGISSTDLQVFYARIQQLSLWHASGPKVLRFCYLTRMWNTRHTKKVLESDQKGEESWSTGALLSMKPRPRTRRTRFRRVATKIQEASAISSIHVQGACPWALAQALWMGSWKKV